METFSYKKQMSNLRAWINPIIIGALFALAFFALFSTSAKTYRSTVSILVIAKSQTAALQESAITRTIAQLPGTLFFYDRLLSDNPSINDPTADLPANERKRLWNTFVSASAPEKNQGSIIKLSVQSKTPADAESLSLKTARTLFSVASGYYNIQNDIDLRIVDGPITQADNSGLYWLAVISLALGAAAACALRIIFQFGKKPLEEKMDIPKESESAFSYFGKSFMESRIKPIASLEDLYASEQEESASAIPLANQQPAEPAKDVVAKPAAKPEKWRYPNFPEMPTGHMAKSSAPANLPIADEAMFPASAPIDTESVSGENETRDTSRIEPTQEEIKARLNQLLGGEL